MGRSGGRNFWPLDHQSPAALLWVDLNIAARLTRYASAWANLDQLRNLTLEKCSLEELVDRAFAYSGAFFAPIQIREEIIEALEQVHQLRPRYIVEVGTAGGGTMLLWLRVAHPEATIVTIDLPGGDFGGGSSKLRVPLFRRLGLPGQTIHLIRGDSHDPATAEQTRTYLNGNAADFLFIDADHTPAGVRADYAMYSPLVRTGGMIAFHDIAIKNPEYGVKKLWEELSATMPSRAILGSPTAYGIGLLHC
jgi:cephalosporin hydroxylase